MKEIVAIVRPERWRATNEAAIALGLEAVAHLRVLGRGHQSGLRYLRRPVKGEVGGMEFLPKNMLGWLVPDELVDELVAEVVRVNQTGNFGDGKIFVCPVESVAATQDWEIPASRED